MFTELEINGQVYKLRLRTIDIVQLEKKLGHNLMDMFMAIQQDKLPQLREMLAVLQASMNAYNHGMNEAKLYELYDQYIAEGHTMFDLVPLVLELMQKGGIIPNIEDQPEQE